MSIDNRTDTWSAAASHDPLPRPEAQGPVVVAAMAPGTDGLDDLSSLLAMAAASGVQLVVLPELTGHPKGLARQAADRPTQAIGASDAMVRSVRDMLVDSETVAVTSVVDRVGTDLAHSAIVIGAGGPLRRTPSITTTDRHGGWARHRGDTLATVDLGWGRLAALTGDDAFDPEIVAAVQRFRPHIVAVSTEWTSNSDPEKVRRLSLDVAAPVVASARRRDGLGPAIITTDGTTTEMTAPTDSAPLVWATVDI